MAWKPTPAQQHSLEMLQAGRHPERGPDGQQSWGAQAEVFTWRQGRDGVNAICHRDEPDGPRLFRVHRDGKVDKL